MKRIKVRFNLSQGKNYMKWKITYPTEVKYFDPKVVQLIMKGCQLKNQKSTAEKIFNGQHKSVCAWVLCEDVQVLVDPDIELSDVRVKYNPRVQPNWVLNDKNVDDHKFELIHSKGSSLYVMS